MGVSGSKGGARGDSPSPLPSLPPFPREVIDHCDQHGCKLEELTLDLPITEGCDKSSSYINDGITIPRTREYIVHMPTLTNSNDEDRRIPLVMCLHGTDETVHDTELLAQCNDKTAWLDLSHQEDIMLVFPQSLRYSAKGDVPVSWRPPGDSLRSGWQPDHHDELFVSCLLDRLLSKYPVDHSRVYCIGFSNGGLFLTSLLLSHGLNTRFAAVCNYMGGACPTQMTDEGSVVVEEASNWIDKPCTSLLGVSQTVVDMATNSGNNSSPVSNTGASLVNVFKKPLPWTPGNGSVDSQATPPIYIVTGSSDSNRNYCYNALCCFKELKYQVLFDDLKGIGHEYQYASTNDIWMFFSFHKRQS